MLVFPNLVFYVVYSDILRPPAADRRFIRRDRAIASLNGGRAFTAQQFFFSLYLLLVSFCFYAWFWTHGGQL